MDAQSISGLRPRLEEFLEQFDDCFGRPEPRGHLRTYVDGQLSDLPRKSVEPIAMKFDTPPRTLQQFLSRAHWDEDRMRRRLHERVAALHTQAGAIGIIDETSYHKKGNKTPGVQRQWCGSRGKTDNCVVSVHLAYAGSGGLRVLLDGELYLPESWAKDHPRREAANIPPAMNFRPKWQIALELLDRAVGHGVRLPWLTFDEGYGSIPQWHAALDQRGQNYVGEVPPNFFGWSQRPQPLQKRHHPKQRQSLKVKSPPASRVDDLVSYSPVFRKQPWQKFHVKDGHKGPIVWEAKSAEFFYSDEGLPSGPHRLIVARNVLEPSEVKYLVSNAPPNTGLCQMLRVGLGRYPVERCFEDDKTELGLDHFEVRNYPSLKRHLIISSLSLMFLAEVHRQDRGKKSGLDGLPSEDREQRNDPIAAAAPGPGACVS